MSAAFVPRWHCGRKDKHDGHGYTGDGYYGPRGYLCDGVPVMSDTEAMLRALIAQVGLDRQQSYYWRERWAGKGHADEIDSWLNSLIDFEWKPANIAPIPGARGESRVAGAVPVAGDPGGIGQRRGDSNGRTQR